LTHILTFEELSALGHDGGYDDVRRYAATLSKAASEAPAVPYMPLSFDPGEAYQFDWRWEDQGTVQWTVTPTNSLP
jgi:hypothetical protein